MHGKRPSDLHAIIIRYARLHQMSHLHSVDQHARQPERDLLRELSSVHGHLEAVSEVDMQDLLRGSKHIQSYRSAGGNFVQ